MTRVAVWLRMWDFFHGKDYANGDWSCMEMSLNFFKLKKV